MDNAGFDRLACSDLRFLAGAGAASVHLAKWSHNLHVLDLNDQLGILAVVGLPAIWLGEARLTDPDIATSHKARAEMQEVL